MALLSILAAGVGITLTAASTVLFAELTWTPVRACRLSRHVRWSDPGHRV